MRALVYDRYGPPDVLRLADVPVPEPGPGQVLLETEAVGLNLSDWECLRGSPAYSRIGGLRRPARRVLGSDVAGRVAAVGAGVTRFRVGDDVYGDNLALKGGLAECTLARESALALRPPGLSAVQAAAIPQPAAIALQGVTGVGPGSRVLVNGAGGGAGSLAVQLAKAAGAHVTGVDNASKAAFVASLGADVVLDHRVDDFTRTAAGYDLVLDLVAHRSVLAYRRALAPGGRYRCVGGTTRALLRVLVGGAVVGALSGRRIGVLAVREGPAAFTPMADRCLAGSVRLHVHREYRLDEAPAALADVGAGRALGKAVVLPRA
ncbi:NAD(P)-dependent alcohol dehydrogenase [Cellulomonas sp. PS-H5]|uniref:NAD(P)-dependent alcohol dehydrogenase n=1 Tax=Cellulomonas sp. PS-H5 TaxID=2820400 RepID=UPI001C4EA3CE|nr:NAD(P)-dependent alcohol dehydrogenase [Cellulomonas sp. PS-H5]MBW0253984.1 NAD(P)-dependent alcohol dehydrogenase [Cellulomonas sp. PS-H5]